MKGDLIRQALSRREAPEHVVTAGASGLVASWERAVQGMSDEVDLGQDDLLNDLDARTLIGIFQRIYPDDWTQEEEARLSVADEQYKSLSTASEECVWGATVALSSHYSAEREWWLYRRLKRTGDNRR